MAPLSLSLLPLPTPVHPSLPQGVLSGEKQRIGRSYDFVQVCEWFAERSDLIILLFDAHKLDISDEFKNVITTMKPHSDKIRVILNKADMITNQQLMRVYGSLMWSLSKVFNTPEVVRVYVGSFWNDVNKDSENYPLLAAEQADLLADLRDLPRNAAVRKINELVKRARLAKVGGGGGGGGVVWRVIWRAHIIFCCLFVSSVFSTRLPPTPNPRKKGARISYWPPQEPDAIRIWEKLEAE